MTGFRAGLEMELSDQVDQARRIAEDLLSDALPRRWAHTTGVAESAAGLARVLTPDWAEDIVAAAWLHDIGYAPDLADTEFHPIDGAAYLVNHQPQLDNLVGLVAHHTGAGFEAEERGLQELLSRDTTASAGQCRAASGGVSAPHRATRRRPRPPAEVSHAGGDRPQSARLGVLVRRTTIRAVG